MTRLFISIIIAVLGSLFLIGVGLDNLVLSEDEPKESDDIIVYRQLIDGFSQQLNQPAAHQIVDKVKTLSTEFGLSLSIDNSNNVALPSSLANQLSAKGGLLLATEQQPYLLKTIPNHPNYLLRLELPTKQAHNESLDIILTITLYLGVCIILIIWLLPLARRLFILTNAANLIGKGEVNIRVAESKLSYIHPLEENFNLMAAQIEKLLNDNKLLARSLSHDIRTPMSCLRFGVEAALSTNDPIKKNNYLERMEAELTNMEQMTSTFLSYAGMERHGVNLKLEPINLNSFLYDVCQELQPLAEQYNIRLVAKLPEKEITYPIDCYWFQRAIDNLINNACQYARSQVCLTLTKNIDDIEITVTDDGKGIANDKLREIFDPFVKLDADRSREQGHFGLGLAICKKVISWHKGAIVAKNGNTQTDSLAGAVFIIHLPKK
ncbi:sensor histidine kinase [Thalassotalea ganghwensis]